MTQPPLQTIGGEPFDPDVDLAGLALRTLGLGAALGAGLEFLVLWGTRSLMAGAAPTDTAEAGGMFYFVIFGTLASMAVGGATAWSLLARIGSIWRRAGLSAIAAFATLVAAAFAVPLDANFGPTSLLAAAAVAALPAFWAGRLVAAWYREQP